MTMMTTVIKIKKVEMVGSTSVKFTLICNGDDFDRVVILMMILGLTAAIRNLLRSFQQRLNQFDNEEAADIGYTKLGYVFGTRYNMSSFVNGSK